MTPLLQFATMTLVLFTLGSIFGSFLNVVIYRTIEGISWVKGRSRCDACKTLIHWYDNIPVFSFLFLRGRCRACNEPISLSHPVVEFLTGSLFVWWYWFGTFFFHLSQAPFQFIQPLFWLLVGMILLMILVTDTLYYVIPDTMVIALFVLTLMYRVSLVATGNMQTIDFLYTVIATVLATLFFASLWFFTQGKGMGFGDVKLVIPLVLLVGWHSAFLALFLAFLFGSVIGVCLLIVRRKTFGQIIPFGPFLIIGAITALIFGENLLQWYWTLRIF